MSLSLRSVPIVTAKRVPEAGLVRKVWSVVWSPLVVLAGFAIAAWLVLRRRRGGAHPRAMLV